MSEIERPSWCQDETCRCLTGYDEWICVGRLPEKSAHDDIYEKFNTHNLCYDRDTLYRINDADAYHLSRLHAGGAGGRGEPRTVPAARPGRDLGPQPAEAMSAIEIRPYGKNSPSYQVWEMGAGKGLRADFFQAANEIRDGRLKVSHFRLGWKTVHIINLETSVVEKYEFTRW